MQTLESPISADSTQQAGGNDPQRFDVREAWYPVFYPEDLPRDRPVPFTLLGEDLAIWWDAQAQCWQAFQDRCPHRLAPLSEGRINEAGLLECPYHGWAFTGSGQCDRIPQQPEGTQAHTAKRACAKTFPTAIAQGLLFIYAGKPENAAATPIPVVDPLEDMPAGWVVLNTFRDLPYDALTLLENVIDSSHIPYTHHQSVGNRANAGPVDLEIVEAGKGGFQGFWQEGPRRGTLGSQHTRFVAPNLMWHDLTSKQFGRTLTVVYATPIAKGKCRLFARFPFKFSSKLPGFFMKLTPRWYYHLGQNGVLEDDQIFLHLQERYLEAGGGSPNYAKTCYLPTKADRFVEQLRQWVNEYQTEPFSGQPLPPTQTREALLDRYHSHTVHCASCAGALANLKRLRTTSGAIAALGWAVSPILAVWLGHPGFWIVSGTSIASMIAGIVWWKLGGLERQFYQGRPIPPRNLGKS